MGENVAKSKYILSLKKEDGTIVKRPWDKEANPTPEETEVLLNMPEPSKPGFLQGIIDPLESMYESVKNTGNTAAKHIKEGNYPAAFGDIVSPVMHPFEGIMGAASGNKPTKPGTELAGQAGIPVDLMKESYANKQYPRLVGQGLTTAAMLGSSLYGLRKPGGSIEAPRELPVSTREHGPYPLRDNTTPIGPKPSSSFEGLSKTTEAPTINWDAEHQAGLPLEFNDISNQPNLRILPKGHEVFGDSGTSPLTKGMMNIEGPKQPELFPNPSPETPIILESKMFDYERPSWSKYAEQRELPLEYDTLSEAELSDVPEVQKAVKQVVKDQHAKVTFNRKTGYSNPNADQTNFSRMKDDWIKSNYTVLVQDSQAGRGIASMIDKYRTETGRTSGSISSAIKDVVEPLNKQQFTQFQQLLDTGADLSRPRVTVENPNVGIKPKISSLAPDNGISNAEMRANLNPRNQPEVNLPPEFAHMTQPSEAAYVPNVDPMVKLALNRVRTIDKQFTDRATASGIHLKDAEGNLVPFTGKDNYWPRIYDHSLFQDKPALIARLIKNGMAPENAKRAVDNSRRFGERLIDPQNARVMDLPDHRKDIGALLKHYDDMSHRIVGAETFGVKDIADPNTPISQLVANTKDPSRITKILTNYLDRDGGVAPYEADLSKKISKVTTLFYLSKFALSNTNQNAFIPVVADFKSTGKAIGQFLTSPKNTWREAEATGALQTVLQEGMRDAGGESFISKAYGIKASEGANRTISAIAGKHFVQDLFNKLQKNPNNARIRKTLEDLTLTNADDLAKQDTLSDKQIAYGATRVAEKTQGRAQSIDLPYNWDKSPYMNLLLLYKKFAFVQGRLLKDALKVDSNQPFVSSKGLNVNPKNAALLATLFQLSGEGTGDAKAAIKGMFTGNPGAMMAQRGQQMNMNPIMNRVVQNYIDSMFLGLLGDAAQSVRGGTKGMYNFIAGPVAGGVIETAGNIQSDYQNRKNLTIKKSNTLRGLATKVPYIGGGIYESMKSK